MDFYDSCRIDVVQLKVNSWGAYTFKNFSKPTVRLMLKCTTNPVNSIEGTCLLGYQSRTLRFLNKT